MMKPACPPPGESAAVETVVAALHAQMIADYPPKAMRRDAHPKAHGTVQADVTVDRAIASDLREGVFSHPGREFRAWIRFSNCFGIQHDLRADTRGMAIKLLGVEAPAFLATEQGTQDFLAGTHDAFFVPDALSYVGFPEAARAGGFATIRFFLKMGLRRALPALRALAASTTTLAMNPLAIPYFSQTPYRLGDDHVVKFQMRPVLSAALGQSLPWAPWFRFKARLGDTVHRLGDLTGLRTLAARLCGWIADPDYLRHAMARSLADQDAWFELLVQRRKGGMPIDDATASWDEAVSPYERVAWIRIPRQVFTPDHTSTDAERAIATEMETIGEHLSFNPWHASAAHEPLGSINRARRRVNAASSETRHRSNEVPLGAPSIEDFDRIATTARLTPGGLDTCPDADPATFTSRWAYLYLRRVPLLTALLAVLFPVASVWTPLSHYTRGLFDVKGPVLALVSLLSFLLAFTVMTTWWTITAYADRRARAVRKFAVYPIRGRWYVVSAALVLPVIAATLALNDRSMWTWRDWLTTAGAWLGGCAGALIIAWTVRWLADWLGGIEPVQRWAKRASHSSIFGDGYVDRARATFLPGHLFATGLALISIGIYISIGRHTAAQVLPSLPALVFLLLLPIVLCWALSAVTFFFDRFRALSLTTLLVALVVVHDRCGTRQVFELDDPIASAAPLPSDVLAAPIVRPAQLPGSGAPTPMPEAPRDTAIVVAISGGGGQSALWSAHVLAGLAEYCRFQGCVFEEHVRLVSATSGGARGAMLFVDGFVDGHLTGPAVQKIRGESSISSQSALWRSLLYQDLFRPFRVWRPTPSPVDRGRALEAAWASSISAEATLDRWTEDARTGRRPGLMFTTTLRGGGQEDMRVQISTAGIAPGAIDFREHYQDRSITIARAARLSASFPLVVPFERDDHGIEPRVLADGGFTDQFGMDAAVSWLNTALAGNEPSTIKRVLVIELRTPALPPSALAPLPRWVDQLDRNQRALALLKQTWRGRVGISSVVLPLCGTPSVGWHTTLSELQGVVDRWNRVINTHAVGSILQFVKAEGPFADPLSSQTIEAGCAP